MSSRVPVYTVTNGGRLVYATDNVNTARAKASLMSQAGQSATVEAWYDGQSEIIGEYFRNYGDVMVWDNNLKRFVISEQKAKEYLERNRA